MALKLNKENFKIYRVTDRESGFSKLQEIRPSLILLDINMPKINGLELCKKIKLKETLKHTPIIILTAKGETDPDRFYAMGMLHDLECLIIFNKMPNRSIKIFEESFKRNEPLFILERESFGFDYSVVADVLLKAWELPDRFIGPIAFHHDPGKSKNFPTEAAILHLGDIMAYELTLEQAVRQ